LFLALNATVVLCAIEGEAQESSAEASKAAASSCSPAVRYHVKGEESFASGDFAGAAHSFEQAVLSDPSEVEYYLDLARSLNAAGDYEKSVPFLQTAAPLATSPAALGMLLRLTGEALVHLQRPADAIEVFSHWISFDPSVEAHLWLGFTVEAIGDAEGARKIYLLTAENYPNDGQPLYRLASLEWKAGDLEAAERDVKLSLTKHDSAEARYLLGKVAMAKEDYRAAIEQFLAALALDRKLVAVHYQVSLCYSRLGETQKAESSAKIYRQLLDEQLKLERVGLDSTEPAGRPLP